MLNQSGTTKLTVNGEEEGQTLQRFAVCVSYGFEANDDPKTWDTEGCLSASVWNEYHTISPGQEIDLNLRSTDNLPLYISVAILNYEAPMKFDNVEIHLQGTECEEGEINIEGECESHHEIEKAENHFVSLEPNSVQYFSFHLEEENVNHLKIHTIGFTKEGGDRNPLILLSSYAVGPTLANNDVRGSSYPNNTQDLYIIYDQPMSGTFILALHNLNDSVVNTTLSFDFSECPPGNL